MTISISNMRMKAVIYRLAAFWTRFRFLFLLLLVSTLIYALLFSLEGQVQLNVAHANDTTVKKIAVTHRLPPRQAIADPPISVPAQWDAPEKHENFLYKDLREGPDISSLLIPNRVPNIVHYVWCRRDWFFFSYYLSVISAFKFLKPSKIVFHYTYHPVTDMPLYNLWFDDLKNEIPNLVMQHINNKSLCDTDDRRLHYIIDVLNERGGIYLSERVWLKSPLPADILASDHAAVSFIGERSSQKKLHYGIILANRNVTLRLEDLQTNMKCALPNQEGVQTFCVVPPEGLYPHKIFTNESSFARFARQLFYGTSAPRIVKPNPSTLIPLLAHYVWMGGAPMNFLAYISIKSCLNILKVPNVLIHGDGPPQGEYWELLKDDPRVHLIHTELPETVFGRKVSDLSHVSDVLRVQLLIKYGGIYTDWDAVWIKSIEDLRGYDTVATYDWPDWHPPYPDKFNMGTLISKPNAKFLHYFLDSMKDFRDDHDHWYYNPVLLPYKVYERHPETLYQNPHLQVICFQFRCHPIFLPGYKDPKIDHLHGAWFDWRKDAYAIHWTMPTPPEFENELALRHSNTMFADIGKYVLDSV